MLCSEPTPTFSHTSPSIYIPFYETPDSWDCITIVSNFLDIVPTHPFDILPCLAPEPFNLASLLRPQPYSSHCFAEFCPYRTDRDPTELWLIARPYQTHVHTLKHSTFCYEHVCSTHYPYGGNKRAKQLSTYLILFISMNLLLIPSYYSLCVLAIISSLLFPGFLLLLCVSACLLWACYCSWFSTRLCLLLYIRPSCQALRP